MACSFIKKETQAQVFSCKFCEVSKNTFFHRIPPDVCFWNFPQPQTTWSTLSCVFLHNLHNEYSWFASIFHFTKFVLIIWFCPAIERLSVSFFKSLLRSNTNFSHPLQKQSFADVLQKSGQICDLFVTFFNKAPTVAASLLISLVCLKYCPCKTLSSQFSDLPSFFLSLVY